MDSLIVYEKLLFCYIAPRKIGKTRVKVEEKTNYWLNLCTGKIVMAPGTGVVTPSRPPYK